MLITHEREKLINTIIFFTQHTKYCGLTKLFKLLYFFDFIHFREAGRSVTGLDYFAWGKGPVPTALFFEIKKDMRDDLKKALVIISPDVDEDQQLTQIKPRQKFDGQYFTKREKRILNELAEIFRDAKANDIVEVSHLRGLPWDKTKNEKGMKKKIDYSLALDGADEKQLSSEELLARLEEMQEARHILK